ncbi:uncharacterized protein EV422DRAFT_522966 [Fimicolochytrium jonesii]|uniref:uncharacterized protein n=1 Tax=Fimicolochytrium jonesii TaxID=1396493 RepID=UPI0022FF1933|nr:uncharacterized protein EV422DRAFT_522966 [Fimicolochytrium jonesii]KAI8822991.1 hypothetical protein EV422DRAFT_522966 [Fimicolochytrium jonesii]
MEMPAFWPLTTTLPAWTRDPTQMKFDRLPPNILGQRDLVSTNQPTAEEIAADAAMRKSIITSVRKVYSGVTALYLTFIVMTALWFVWRTRKDSALAKRSVWLTMVGFLGNFLISFPFLMLQSMSFPCPMIMICVYLGVSLTVFSLSARAWRLRYLFRSHQEKLARMRNLEGRYTGATPAKTVDIDEDDENAHEEDREGEEQDSLEPLGTRKKAAAESRADTLAGSTNLVSGSTILGEGNIPTPMPVRGQNSRMSTGKPIAAGFSGANASAATIAGRNGSQFLPPSGTHPGINRARGGSGDEGVPTAASRPRLGAFIAQSKSRAQSFFGFLFNQMDSDAFAAAEEGQITSPTSHRAHFGGRSQRLGSSALQKSQTGGLPGLRNGSTAGAGASTFSFFNKRRLGSTTGPSPGPNFHHRASSALTNTQSTATSQDEPTRKLLYILAFVIAFVVLYISVVLIFTKQFSVNPVSYKCRMGTWEMTPVLVLMGGFFMFGCPALCWWLWRDHDTYGIRRDLIVFAIGGTTIAIMYGIQQMLLPDGINYGESTLRLYFGASNWIVIGVAIGHLTSIFFPLLGSYDIHPGRSLEIFFGRLYRAPSRDTNSEDGGSIEKLDQLRGAKQTVPGSTDSVAATGSGDIAELQPSDKKNCLHIGTHEAAVGYNPAVKRNAHTSSTSRRTNQRSGGPSGRKPNGGHPPKKWKPGASTVTWTLFQGVLDDETCFESFKTFAARDFGAENPLFYQEYRKLMGEVRAAQEAEKGGPVGGQPTAGSRRPSTDPPPQSIDDTPSRSPRPDQPQGVSEKPRSHVAEAPLPDEHRLGATQSGAISRDSVAAKNYPVFDFTDSDSIAPTLRSKVANMLLAGKASRTSSKNRNSKQSVSTQRSQISLFGFGSSSQPTLHAPPVAGSEGGLLIPPSMRGDYETFYNTFVAPGSPLQVSLPARIVEDIAKQVADESRRVLPLVSVFDEARNEVLSAMYAMFPRFVDVEKEGVVKKLLKHAAKKNRARAVRRTAQPIEAADAPAPSETGFEFHESFGESPV